MPDCQTSKPNEKPKRMFYDMTVDRFSKPVAFDHPQFQSRRNLAEILNETHIFLLNGAVVESLYNITPQDTCLDPLGDGSLDCSDESKDKLPFDGMFFELMDPIDFEYSHEKSAKLKALHFGYGKKYNAMTRHLDEDMFSLNDLDAFYVMFFYQHVTGDDFPTTVVFGRDIEEVINSKKSVVVQRPAAINRNFSNGELDDSLNTGLFIKNVCFCINVISYINAHNVEVREQSRFNPNLYLKNKRRERRSVRRRPKKPLPQLRPYYWIDIKPQEVTKRGDYVRGGAGGRELTERHYVRGHFQRYRIADGNVVKNWINPYVRGPDGAPFRNDRYKVLDDMLKKGNKY
ncbi:MAG: hypothetical protein ABIG89_06835 [Candidatus Woesearchaeota archaeon]